MSARLAFCSCYDICVFVSASYNQWQEYICGKNIYKIVDLKKKTNMFKVHLNISIFTCV